MTETRPLSERLRISVEALLSCGYSDPGPHGSGDPEVTAIIEADDALDAQAALLGEAAEVLAIFADYSVSSIGTDLDGYVIKLAAGQQPTFNDFDRAKSLLSRIEAVK